MRVVAATNRDLEAEVERGAFRRDLYYRLNVIQLHLPPLRARREDIPLLVEHFLASTPRRSAAPLAGVEPDALAALCDYDFPGNVRELENIIERAVTLEPGERITRASLPELATRRTPGAGRRRRASPTTASTSSAWSATTSASSSARRSSDRAASASGGQAARHLLPLAALPPGQARPRTERRQRRRHADLNHRTRFSDDSCLQFLDQRRTAAKLTWEGANERAPLTVPVERGRGIPGKPSPT